MRALRGLNATAVIAKLNPIIRGWAACYRGWWPAASARCWITTCGGSPTGGPDACTPTSRLRR
ncbi:group II intron maturase-specific domain-containing protein [Streptomyces sp. NPDC032198]|uniref:group II intron maturase-specific domain-containing protein n=1 Tax=Streptomyces sp. NPDC032198 TaxID=3155127 RepID=UPI0033EB1B02